MRVLVTGGTSGLGLAMATALAAAGSTVALTGRSGERARSVAAELPGTVGLELDVRDERSVARAVDQACSQVGPAWLHATWDAIARVARTPEEKRSG